MSEDQNGDRIRAIRVLDRTVSQLNQRLSTLESRLNNQQKIPIMEERRVPDDQGLLGGKALFTNQAGGIEKEIRIPVCDMCGHSLKTDEEFTICLSCGKKLDSKCSISYQNRTVCLECLRTILPLTKRSYKVLLAVANEITSIASISDISRVEKEDVRASIEELLDLNLVVKKGISIFSVLNITDEGLEAIAAYRQVYTDEDVLQFESEIQKNLLEPSGG